MSQTSDAPSRYEYSGVEFNIWDDNESAGPDGWSVYPKDDNLAVLQYKDVPKGDLIEDIERRIDEDDWPEREELDEAYRRSVKYEDRKEV